MTEYQRGLEAAAKKVKELWHHPYADELAAAIRGLSSTDFGSSNLPPTAAVGAPKGNSVGDLQSSGGKLGFIAHCLACRAKELVEGMQSRCKRLPDRADFLAAFEDELKKGLTPQEVCPTCGSADKGIFDASSANPTRRCWAKGFHDPWHDGGLTPQPDYSWGFCDVHTGMHAYFAKPGQKSPACVNWRKVEAVGKGDRIGASGVEAPGKPNR